MRYALKDVRCTRAAVLRYDNEMERRTVESPDEGIWELDITGVIYLEVTSRLMATLVDENGAERRMVEDVPVRTFWPGGRYEMGPGGMGGQMGIRDRFGKPRQIGRNKNDIWIPFEVRDGVHWVSFDPDNPPEPPAIWVEGVCPKPRML